MSEQNLRGSEALNEATIEDVRWRLETAMEKLDEGLPQSALQLVGEARMVIEAMVERWESDKHREARLAREAAWEGP